MSERQRHRDRDRARARSKILRNLLAATCDEGTFRPARKCEKKRKNMNSLSLPSCSSFFALCSSETAMKTNKNVTSYTCNSASLRFRHRIARLTALLVILFPACAPLPTCYFGLSVPPPPNLEKRIRDLHRGERRQQCAGLEAEQVADVAQLIVFGQYCGLL